MSMYKEAMVYKVQVSSVFCAFLIFTGILHFFNITSSQVFLSSLLYLLSHYAPYNDGCLYLGSWTVCTNLYLFIFWTQVLLRAFPSSILSASQAEITVFTKLCLASYFPVLICYITRASGAGSVTVASLVLNYTEYLSILCSSGIPDGQFVPEKSLEKQGD